MEIEKQHIYGEENIPLTSKVQEIVSLLICRREKDKENK
jgi:hypothetical protein